MVRYMHVVDYCADWPMLAAREAALLCGALGCEVIRAHHIGSTAVPGLAAKPILDILLEVRSLAGLDASSEAMREFGYQPRGEAGIPGRRYYPKGGDVRTHHVHAFAVGDPHIWKHLAFRDYLRAHPAATAAYAAIKREASAMYETDPDGYVAHKRWFVEQTLTKAVHWAKKSDPIGWNARQEDGP